MAKYIKYNTNSTTDVLIGKNESQQTGNISKISICNERTVGSSSTKVGLFLHDGNSANNIYIIRQVEIPEGVTLVLEDNLSFNISKYSLCLSQLYAGTGSIELSIIIK